MRLFLELVSSLAAATLLFSSFPGASSDDDIEFIRNRLAERSVLDNQRCGQWATGYADLHQSMLNAVPSEQRLLVSVPHISGMADRIIGFSTIFLVATLTGRAFQMGRRESLPQFESAFDSPNINWSRPLDPDWLIEPLKLHASSKNYNDSVLRSKQYYAVNFLDNIPYIDKLVSSDLHEVAGGDARVTMMISNRGKTIRMFDSSHVGSALRAHLTPYTAFGCCVNYLLQPKPQIFLPLLEQFKAMSSLDPSVLKISIQIRVGDWAWDARNHKALKMSPMGTFHRYFSCAQQIEEFAMQSGNYKSVLWYLATESMPLRRAAVKEYGEKIVTSLNTRLEHSAKEESVCDRNSGTGQSCEVSTSGFTFAAAEWWLLGFAHFHVITRYSGFGRSGAFRTLTGDAVYTVHDSEVSCDKRSFSSLETMMYDWSGI